MPIVQCVPVERQVASDRNGRLESALRYSIVDRVLSHRLLDLVVSSARDQESGRVARGMTGASLGIGAWGRARHRDWSLHYSNSGG